MQTKMCALLSLIFNCDFLMHDHLHPAGLEPATPVTKLKLAWARFGGLRFGLVLC
jgi:hypothetical protein